MTFSLFAQKHFKADFRAHEVGVSALPPNQTACSLHHKRVSSTANIERVAWLANVNTTSSSAQSSDTVEKHEFDVNTMSGNCSREVNFSLPSSCTHSHTGTAWAYECSESWVKAFSDDLDLLVKAGG